MSAEKVGKPYTKSLISVAVTPCLIAIAKMWISSSPACPRRCAPRMRSVPLSLNREDRPIAVMCTKGGDTARRRRSVCGGVPVGVERHARRRRFAGFSGKKYLAPHQPCRADVEDDRLDLAGKRPRRSPAIGLK